MTSIRKKDIEHVTDSSHLGQRRHTSFDVSERLCVAASVEASKYLILFPPQL